jgi:hypothetical protein
MLRGVLELDDVVVPVPSSALGMTAGPRASGVTVLAPATSGPMLTTVKHSGKLAIREYQGLPIREVIAVLKRERAARFECHSEL